MKSFSKNNLACSAMMRCTVTLILTLLIFIPSHYAQANEVITNETVLQLVEIGLSKELIISKIENSDSDFSVEITDIISLKEKGITDDIITAMIESHGLQSLESDIRAPGDYSEIIPLLKAENFQEAYAKLAEIRQSDSSNRENDLVELEIMVAEAKALIKKKDPSWKIKTRTAAVKLKTIYRTYYTDTRYWMAYAQYYWMLGRESGTLKCLKKVHYYEPTHLEGLILKGEAIMKSLQDTPYSDEDSESMFREGFMDKGREAFREALQTPNISDIKKAEIYYKFGVYEKEIFKNKTKAKRYWNKSIESAPDSEWAILAQESLTH